MLRSKEGPNQPGPIFSTIYILLSYNILLINYSLRDPNYIRPECFILATPIRDPRFATHIRGSTRDSHSRLAFTTPLATPIHESRSRLHLRLTIATPNRSPNHDSLFFCRDFRCATPPLTDRLC